MAKKDVFADFEDRTEQRKLFEKKSNIIEKAGWVMAAVTLFSVVIVMTSNIKLVTISTIAELSLAVFVLIFLSYSMYGNMYQNGTIAAQRLDEYTNTLKAYLAIRDDVKNKTLHKDLAQFCKEYVAAELKAQREMVLEAGNVTWAEYQKYKDYSKEALLKTNMSKRKIKAIIDANWIVPIKLTPEMLYRVGGRGVRTRPLGTAPSTRRTIDFSVSFARTTITSLCMCFIAFELFADPSWQMVCAVVIKLLTVSLNGFLGYRRGYDNIAVDTINYTEDQIDLLEQFKIWRAPEIIIEPVVTDNLLTDNQKETETAEVTA